MKTRASNTGKDTDAVAVAGDGSEASKKHQSWKATLPRNLSSIVAMKNWVKQRLHGQDITTNVSLRVLRGALKMQEDYLLTLQKKGGDKNGAVKSPSVRKTICGLFAISEHNYSAILGSYLQNKTIYSSGETGEGRTGNSNAKDGRIPYTKAMTISIREFVWGRRAKRERTTAKQVMEYLVSQNVLHIPKDLDGLYCKKEYNSTYRNVRRFVAKLGYRRGRRTGNIVPSTALILKRVQYLKAFHNNRSKPEEARLREVYMDESYIHEHYHRNDDSIWDPNDDQDVQFKKAPAKGRRYCFAAAIQGPSWKGNGSGGLVPGSLWKFCPQKKGGHTGDYHKDFESTNFTKWWTNQLLPNLQEPSLIILDNASHHCCKHPDTPKPAKMKKQECIEFLAANAPAAAVAAGSMTSVELKEEVKKFIEANIPMEIVRLAEEKGHKVLFTPPYHSDLQPIELVWALVKGNVGRQYGVGTTLEIVNQRLEQEFVKLLASGQDSVERMIEKCANIATKMYGEAMEADSSDDEQDDDDEEPLEDSNDDSDDERDDEQSDNEESAEDFDDNHVEV